MEELGKNPTALRNVSNVSDVKIFKNSHMSPQKISGLLDEYGDDIISAYRKYGDIIDGAPEDIQYIVAKIIVDYQDEVADYLRINMDDFATGYKSGGQEYIDDLFKKADDVVEGGTDVIKTNKIPDNDSTIGHIFRDAEGHIPDTPENRALLENVANNIDNF